MQTFTVPDIHCDACIRSLTAAARELDPAAEVSADLATKRVTVRSAASHAAVAAAFEDAGFVVEAAR
jgi:copper chaperone